MPRHPDRSGPRADSIARNGLEMIWTCAEGVPEMFDGLRIFAEGRQQHRMGVEDPGMVRIDADLLVAKLPRRLNRGAGRDRAQAPMRDGASLSTAIACTIYRFASSKSRSGHGHIEPAPHERNGSGRIARTRPNSAPHRLAPPAAAASWPLERTSSVLRCSVFQPVDFVGAGCLRQVFRRTPVLKRVLAARMLQHPAQSWERAGAPRARR